MSSIRLEALRNNMVKTILNKVCLNITDGIHGDCEAAENNSSGYYFISSKDIEHETINYVSARQITKRAYEKADLRTMLEENDILYTNSGTIGRSVFVTKENSLLGFTTFQKSVAIIKPDPEKVEPYYLYLLMNLYTESFKKNSNSSNQTNLLLDTLRQFPVSLPERDVQIKKAKIIRNIDDLIFYNLKTIHTLKSKMDDFYRYIFEQFSLDEDPDENSQNFVFNEQLKRYIPKGWVVKKLGDFVESISKSVSYPDNKAVIDLSIMQTDEIALNEASDSSEFSTNLKELYEGAILFGSIRPYLRKCVIAPFNGYHTGTVFQFKSKITSFDCYPFLLSLMTSPAFFKYAVSNSTGTKMPVVTDGNLLSFPFAYNEEAVKDFCLKFNYYNLIKNLSFENLELRKIRGELLSIIMDDEVIVE